MSSATTASDAGTAAGASQYDGHLIKGQLPTPKITQLQRLDLNRVKVTWECAMPGVSPDKLSKVKLVIMRQAFDGNWERAYEQAWPAAGGTWVDGASPIAKIWRYTAITDYQANSNGAFSIADAGSDANPPQELDYGPSTYGILGYRSGIQIGRAHV